MIGSIIYFFLFHMFCKTFPKAFLFPKFLFLKEFMKTIYTRSIVVIWLKKMRIWSQKYHQRLGDQRKTGSDPVQIEILTIQSCAQIVHSHFITREPAAEGEFDIFTCSFYFFSRRQFNYSWSYIHTGKYELYLIFWNIYLHCSLI